MKAKLSQRVIQLCFLAFMCRAAEADNLQPADDSQPAKRQIASLVGVKPKIKSGEWQVLAPGWRWQLDHSNHTLNLAWRLPGNIEECVSQISDCAAQILPQGQQYFRDAEHYLQAFSRQLNSLPLVTPVNDGSWQLAKSKKQQAM